MKRQSNIERPTRESTAEGTTRFGPRLQTPPFNLLVTTATGILAFHRGRPPRASTRAQPPVVSEKTLQWLRDAPEASAEALAALTAGPVPPDPEPIPPDPPSGDSDMDYPKDERELRQLFDQYAAYNYVGMLDPRTDIRLSETLVWKQQSNAGRPWGCNGNYARITMDGVGDVIRVEGVQDVSNRGFTFKNFSIDGGDPNLNGSKGKACLKLSAPLGDYGPLYKFNIENVFTMAGEYGFVLEGGVYEGWMLNCHAENCARDGTFMQHLNLGQPGQGVVSNILMIHPNMSRNLGAGIRCVYSVNIIGGSFILNGDGGVNAADGLRSCILSNGENTAGRDQACFVVPNNGYGSVIDMCEASGDGQTVCRKWDGSQWVDIGSPMLYGIAAGGGVVSDPARSHTSYYGGGSDPMRWRK